MKSLPQPPSALGFHLLNDCAIKGLTQFKDSAIDLTITSPPYFHQKDYGCPGQLGWEDTLDAYLAKLRKVLCELIRITKPSGSCFFVIGDSYFKRSLQLVPQRLAILATECGWTIRNDLIWAKPDAAPGGGQNRWRFVHEHILFLTKASTQYYFSSDDIRVPYQEATIKRWGSGQKYGGAKSSEARSPSGQRFPKGKSFQLNPKGTLPPDVLYHPTARSRMDHYATFPPPLIERFVLSACPPLGVVLDPFAGTATTGISALQHNRSFVGIEISKKYYRMGIERIHDAHPTVPELAVHTFLTP